MTASCNYRLFDLAQYPELGASLPQTPIANKPTEENFASIFQTVIEPKCLSCHKSGSGSRAEKLPLTTYEELFNGENDSSAFFILPGNPEESLFYKVLLPETKQRMPPKKSEIAPVEDDRIQVIRAWIKNGAKEK